VKDREIVRRRIQGIKWRGTEGKNRGRDSGRRKEQFWNLNIFAHLKWNLKKLAYGSGVHMRPIQGKPSGQKSRLS
jgi:hypothetical protein